MAAYEYVGLGNDDGTIMGRSSTDLIAFHGATPTARHSIASVLTSATTVALAAGLAGVMSILNAKGLLTLT